HVDHDRSFPDDGPRETRAGAPCEDGDLPAVRKPDNGGDLFLRMGSDDDGRDAFVVRHIPTVLLEELAFLDHVRLPDAFLQFRRQPYKSVTRGHPRKESYREA